MPVSFDYSEPDYAALAKRRAEIEAALIARGMVRGHGKFSEVVARKMRKHRW